MKVLHTADWHLGLKLQNIDLKEDHQLFLDYLLGYIQEEKIDVLLISGDIFDQAYPSQSALSLYYNFLAQLIPLNIEVVITAGNHDAPSVLNGPKDILSRLKVHVYADINREDPASNILKIKKEDQEIAIAAIPFIRDQHLRVYGGQEDFESVQDQVKAGIQNCYDSYAQEIKDFKGPKIAMGHLMVMGGAFDQSMREIQVGNLGAFPAQDFPADFDYVALGHVHKPMTFNEGRIRYSGSPIPLSFSEKNYKKQFLVLHIDQNKINDIETIAIPQHRRFIEITGNTEQCWEQLFNLNNEMTLLPFLSLEVIENTYQLLSIEKFKAYLEEYHMKSFILVKDRYHLEKVENNTNTSSSIKDISSIQPNDILDIVLEDKPLPETDSSLVKEAFTELLNELHHENQ